jgi:hypothetical protein
VLDVVPDTISLAHPADNTHGNMDDSDIEPDVIAAMPPHAKVSTLLAARPVPETGLGQSSSRCEPAEPAVPPRVQVLASKLLELKAARLSRQAHRLNQKAQAGLRPSDDEARPTTRPTERKLVHSRREAESVTSSTDLSRSIRQRSSRPWSAS